MENLKNTVYVLAVIAISTGVLDILNTSETLGKYTKYITSLVVILSLITPFKSFVSDFSYILTQSNENFNTSTPETPHEIKSALTSAINYDLSYRLSIPEEVFKSDITLTSNQSDTLVESITITITDTDYNRYSERIEHYLKSNYGCSVSVIKSIKE